MTAGTLHVHGWDAQKTLSINPMPQHIEHSIWAFCIQVAIKMGLDAVQGCSNYSRELSIVWTEVQILQEARSLKLVLGSSPSECPQSLHCTLSLIGPREAL